MSKDISNIVIEKLFKEINNEDINKNFLGLFLSGKINKSIIFEKMMPGNINPFLISNTDRSDQVGTHWWSIMYISPKGKLGYFLLV